MLAALLRDTSSPFEPLKRTAAGALEVRCVLHLFPGHSGGWFEAALKPLKIEIGAFRTDRYPSGPLVRLPVGQVRA